MHGENFDTLIAEELLQKLNGLGLIAEYQAGMFLLQIVFDQFQEHTCKDRLGRSAKRIVRTTNRVSVGFRCGRISVEREASDDVQKESTSYPVGQAMDGTGGDNLQDNWSSSYVR